MASSRRDFLKKMTIMSSFPFLDINALKNIREDSSAIPSPGKEYNNIIIAPEDPAKWPGFRKELYAWRASKRQELSYKGSAYEDPAFQWANRNYTCCFLMMYDLNFYNREEGRYTVDKILRRGEDEFGGYDSIVLWHAYPRIGIDERNQFDFYRDMPGGLDGLNKVVREFHAKDVRVFINYNPWDTGTRRELKTDIDALVEIVAGIDADGIFLDTMKEAKVGFREKLDKIKPP